MGRYLLFFIQLAKKDVQIGLLKVKDSRLRAIRMQDAPLPDSGSEGDYRGGETEKVDVSGREAEAHEVNCTICGAKKASALLDLRSNQAMHRRLSREWKMQVRDSVETLTNH